MKKWNRWLWRTKNEKVIKKSKGDGEEIEKRWKKTNWKETVMKKSKGDDDEEIKRRRWWRNQKEAVMKKDWKGLTTTVPESRCTPPKAPAHRWTSPTAWRRTSTCHWRGKIGETWGSLGHTCHAHETLVSIVRSTPVWTSAHNTPVCSKSTLHNTPVCSKVLYATHLYELVHTPHLYVAKVLYTTHLYVAKVLYTTHLYVLVYTTYLYVVIYCTQCTCTSRYHWHLKTGETWE